MIEIWKDAKKNKKVLHFENFQNVEFTWEDAVNFVYDEHMNNRVSEQWAGYFFLQNADLFKYNGVSELMKKVNGMAGSQYCEYYKYLSQEDRTCNCDMYWHIQTLRFSITNHKVPNHNDPVDVLYLQLLGTSYWKINDDKVYKLNPGDLFYFNQEDTHAVEQDGPRAGIIIDGRRRPVI